jgi:DNA topoisomerase-3
LFKRKYIEKKKKNLYPTQTGMDLIDTIQNEILKSAELTGDWEKKLRLIEKGEYSIEIFKKELIQMVSDLCEEVIFNTRRVIAIQSTNPSKEEPKERKKASPKEKVSMEEINCPKCKTNLLKKGKSAYGCTNFAVCGFKIPFEILGVKLTEKQFLELLAKGKTGKIKGLQIPGKSEPTDGKLVFTSDFNIGVE